MVAVWAGLICAIVAAGAAGRLAAQSNAAAMDAIRRRLAEKPAFYCNLNALSPKERAAHEKLTKKIFEAQVEIKELEDGFAIQLPRDKISMAELGEWITKEDMCCSFFHLEIESERNRGPLWLKIRGGEGIKKFIRETFPAMM